MNIEDFNLLKRFDLQSSSIKLFNQLVACRIICLHEEFQLFMLKKCSLEFDFGLVLVVI